VHSKNMIPTGMSEIAEARKSKITTMRRGMGRDEKNACGAWINQAGKEDSLPWYPASKIEFESCKEAQWILEEPRSVLVEAASFENEIVGHWENGD